MLGCIDLYRLTRPNLLKCNRRLGRPRGEVGRVGGLAGGHAGRRRADQAGSTAGCVGGAPAPPRGARAPPFQLWKFSGSPVGASPSFLSEGGGRLTVPYVRAGFVRS